MDPILERFLGALTQVGEGAVSWASGTLPLEERAYLTADLPPDPYITSVRAVVFKGEDVLVIHDATGAYLVPGGRRKPGETLEETVRRELLEETGWAVGELLMMGIIHFHHLEPKPEGYAYAYPDFLHLIYCADADHHVPEAMLPDEWVVWSEFRPVREVQAMNFRAVQIALLNAAATLRGA